MPFDRTLSFSEYDLYANELISYGIEYNYSYKNSTTIRLIVNSINSLFFGNTNLEKNNIYNYGIGFRLKSIIGPVNFLWSNSQNFYDSGRNDNYFFSLGVNI